MQLTQIVYASSYIDEYGLELPDFLENSALGTGELNVFGMTLFSHGNIIQLLEGKRTAVNQILQNFPLNAHQFGVVRLIQSPVEARCIKQTSIGFGMHSLRLIKSHPTKISLFELNPHNVRNRIEKSSGRILMENFARDCR
jgi:hypothetical protein